MNKTKLRGNQLFKKPSFLPIEGMYLLKHKTILLNWQPLHYGFCTIYECAPKRLSYAEERNPPLSNHHCRCSYSHNEQIACGLDRMMIPKHERDYISLYLMTLIS